ncbi:PAQR family membrane homeostasis protein TrhA [Clostridium pasteurianum]|uniref:Channel protein, hemolysin III family n=1 Tax=Clostridium pasteurianum BC1 TaxID=86416 RepID=R4KBE0_CLOPA|nr:hemolysin III family protein [Clostridium pasteurianum]AGK96945.1 channel protein, hemolysin III family [Clostridium pasteurianum BC1]
MFAKFREPVSGLTHLFGVGISIVGLIILINYTLKLDNLTHISAFVVFGVSLILLYSASSVYHLTSASQKVIKVLRRIDHSMIYILIAGSYTPICLIALRGKLGLSILVIIWCLAIFGILVKNFWFNAPRWLSTFFYIFMGWLVIVAIFPLAKVLTGIALTWLVVGGISYTIGGIIYGLQLPKMKNKYFGSHEIFHIFVLLGSFCHYWLVLKYVSIM